MEKSDKEKAQELFEKGVKAFVNEDLEAASNFFKSVIKLNKNYAPKEHATIEERDIEREIENFIYRSYSFLWNIAKKEKNLEAEKKYSILSKKFESKNIDSIDRILIENYFSLEKIDLKKLKNKKEIYFLGDNGNGKTILLQAIILALKQKFIEQYGNKTLISEALQFLSENKNFKFKIYDGKNNKYQVDIPSFDSSSIFAKNIYAYGVNRSRKEEEREDKYGFMTLFSNRIELNNPVDWLKNLDYYESKEGYDSPFPLKTAIEILKSILDNNVVIEVSPRGVIFTEKGTKLEFDQLSDGYKSVLIWVSDLIVKLAESQPDAKKTEDFKGVVLVDEIDLHLHPKWAYSIMTKLRNWFPKIQWFITTHSHDVIRGAGEDAVFYRLYKEYSEEHQQNVVKISEPYDVKEFENAMSNVVATSPLFDLSHARMKTYKNGNLETDDDYYYAKIHRQVRADIEQMKKEGKINIPKKAIDNLIKKAIEKYS